MTSVAQGYKQPELVGYNLFPRVPVGTRAGNIVTFGKEDFMLYNTQRAPGENPPRAVRVFGRAFALVDYTWKAPCPSKCSKAAAPEKGYTIDAAAIALRKPQSILLRLEKAQADLARTAGNYGSGNKTTLSGTSRWSDLTTGVSDPIRTWRPRKKRSAQRPANARTSWSWGRPTLAKLRQHPKIIDRMKYTGRDVPTVEILASLFGIAQVVVGEAIYSNDAGTRVYRRVGQGRGDRLHRKRRAWPTWACSSYGYNNLDGYPIAEVPYFDRNAKSQFSR